MLVCTLCGLPFKVESLPESSQPGSEAALPLDLEKLVAAAPGVMTTCREALAWIKARPADPEAQALAEQLEQALQLLEAAHVREQIEN